MSGNWGMFLNVPSYFSPSAFSLLHSQFLSVAYRLAACLGRAGEGTGRHPGIQDVNSHLSPGVLVQPLSSLPGVVGPVPSAPGSWLPRHPDLRAAMSHPSYGLAAAHLFFYSEMWLFSVLLLPSCSLLYSDVPSS